MAGAIGLGKPAWGLAAVRRGWSHAAYRETDYWPAAVRFWVDSAMDSLFYVFLFYPLFPFLSVLFHSVKYVVIFFSLLFFLSFFLPPFFSSLFAFRSLYDSLALTRDKNEIQVLT